MKESVRLLKRKLHEYETEVKIIKKDGRFSDEHKVNLLAQAKAQARQSVENLSGVIFGQVKEQFGPLEGGQGWRELEAAQAALSEAQGNADTLDQTRLSNTLTMVPSIMTKFQSPEEFRTYYTGLTDPYTRRALQMAAPAAVKAKFGAVAGVGSLLAGLEADYNQSLETPEVQAARERIAEVSGQMHEAYDALQYARKHFEDGSFNDIGQTLQRIATTPNKYTGTGQWSKGNPYEHIHQATEQFAMSQEA
jgi:hypothetical protein